MRSRIIRLLGCNLVVAASVCLLPLRAAEGGAPADSTAGNAPSMSAGTKAQSPAAKRTARNSRYPFRGHLKAVDLKAKTFTVAGGQKDRVFRTDDQTVFSRGNSSVALSNGVAGEAVGGLVEKQPDGSLLALNVRFGPKSDDANAGQGSGNGKGTATKSKKAGGS